MNEDLKNLLLRVRALYMKYGIKSITMDDLARDLGISKSTLSNYVADKDDILVQCINNEIKLRHKHITNGSRTRNSSVDELFEISLFMN